MIEKIHSSLDNLRERTYDNLGFESLYLGTLNRMLYLKRENEELLEIINSESIQFILKYKRTFRIAGRFFMKLRQLLGK
ncbi:MAG: hypothetical protein WDO19_10050 [Bacteroidota bacterium]